jgi:hypothetical protein
MLMPFDMKNLHAAKAYARNRYVWPGGYPMTAITADGGCLCADCVHAEWKQICAESFQNTNCGFRIAGVEVNWENPELYCDHCSARIESACAED